MCVCVREFQFSRTMNGARGLNNERPSFPLCARPIIEVGVFSCCRPIVFVYMDDVRRVYIIDFASFQSNRYVYRLRMDKFREDFSAIVILLYILHDPRSLFFLTYAIFIKGVAVYRYVRFCYWVK